MQKIRKGDDVVVIAGKYKGSRGKVLRVLPAKDKVLVAGVNVVTKHVEADQAKPAWRHRPTRGPDSHL